MIIIIGVTAILFVNFIQSITNTDEHNYNLLKETTEAAMYDAIDFASYRKDGVERIDREKFVENFLRRFAGNAQLSQTYQVDIYDVNETPPKVSIRVKTNKTDSYTFYADIASVDINNHLDAVLETPN